ncbi:MULTISPECIES: betaine/proline/choline family ABC transporter ATP-binding protein [unclassified Erysipelothrix]|uniref:betaine/proline/choline family ABC transporter ATP-binding protein n=1 Tax=unclassified Erysipelothrix TaxID=2624170 RepID=UPI0013770C22|nr:MULTISPECIES: betaine/proline/choline family ABC transporter ATP-binding protein [unclassified Erysipelothrix]MBK2402147.1 ATP-binding cassette domain-containing protein [Erysipelothrix sp. strain 2 (EsS2-6-Brazil)]MBK2404567.1 ATP-binding cassette domain-containing protein [Erysipelothrix sp. strain 2 (EsS2-7-Brazil)]NBA01183.1 betaine/proline/choline family ABC transporter ATP-binding protein [Erysipelothrix rhusiopathiae]
MIEYRNVKKVYNDKVVIENLNLTINQGEFVCLIGPSGCGKTTTLKMLNRIIKHDGGEIYIKGQKIDDMNVIDLRRNIGYVIQQIGLFPNMTLADNIAIVPRLLKWDEQRIDERVRELMPLVGMPYETYASRYPSELSGGQQQRIGVLRALAANPPVILMDEPFGALDPVTRDALQDEVKSIQEKLGITIVFVTHDMDEAIKMADTIVFMEGGKIVQKATPEEMLRHPATKQVKQFMGKQMHENGSSFDLTCGDLMKPNVFKVFERRPILECLGLMRTRDLNSVVVVDEAKRYLGVAWIDEMISKRDTYQRVSEVVERSVPAFNQNEDAQQAIGEITENKRDYVIVINDDREVMGIITRGSIARSLTNVVWGGDSNE